MRRLAALVAVAAAAVAAPAAHAAPPAVRVDPGVVSIGQRARVEVTGFPQGRSATVTLCGNEGRRGSVDCDLPGSVAFPINRFDNVHVTDFPIGTPPVPCPCVVKVTNAPGNDVAYAPVAIEGFPTAPVVDNKLYEPLALTLRVRRASQSPLSWLRSQLGGPTAYDLDVAVHNRTSDAVEGVRVRARAGRSATDQSRRVALAAPRTLAAGQTWRSSTRVTLSAPVVGDFVWTVTSAGDGTLARSQAVTDHTPFGLYCLVLVLLGDLAWIGWRRVRKLRRRVAADDRRVPPPLILDLRSPTDEAGRPASPAPPAARAARPTAEALLARPVRGQGQP